MTHDQTNPNRITEETAYLSEDQVLDRVPGKDRSAVRRRVRRWRKRGVLRAVRLPGTNTFLYPVKDVEEWLRGRAGEQGR